MAVTAGMGLALARTILNSQIPPREMRPKPVPEPKAEEWTWARFEGDEREPTGR